MNIFILRHGVAVDEEEWNLGSDSERPLTADGQRQVRKIAGALKRLELKFEIIISSPCERAKRTAEIVAENLGLKKRLVFSKELESEGDPKKLIRDIRKLKTVPENILLVGHEPYLSELISVLLTGKKKMEIDLKKASLCKLVVEKLEYDHCAVLSWLMTSRQMELISG